MVVSILAKDLKRIKSANYIDSNFIARMINLEDKHSSLNFADKGFLYLMMNSVSLTQAGRA